MQPYATWGFCVGLGAALAYLDLARLRRPLFGLMLLAGVVGGYSTTILSPFSFGGAGWYMEGALLAMFSGAGLAGYLGVGGIMLTGLGVRRLVVGERLHE